MKIDVKSFTINTICCVVTVFLCLLNSTGSLNIILCLLIFLLGIIGLLRAKNNWFLLFIYFCFFYSNYSICVAEYIFPVNSFFSTYAKGDTGVIGINLLALFSLILVLIVPKIDKLQSDEKKSITINNKDNKIITIVLCLALILIWIYGFTRPDVEGQRGSPSTIYEYSIILVIMGFYYSGKNQLIQTILILIVGAYALQNFIYGGRITGIQLIVCTLMCLFIDRFKFKWVLPIGIIFFILMSAVGQFRASLVLTGNVISAVLLSISNGKFALDTAYSAYHTSMTFIMTENTLGWNDRIYMFFKWILSIFVGGSVPDSNLGVYTHDLFLHYYGGVLPYYFHFYLGIIGVLLIGIYLHFLFRFIVKTNSNSSGYIRCLTVYITATTLRWYLYSPSQIFRGILLLSFVYAVLYGFNSIVSKSSLSRI